MDLLCKKFEGLAQKVLKKKCGVKGKGVPHQDIVCHKCKKAGQYDSRCQLSTKSISICTYCVKYRRSKAYVTRSRKMRPGGRRRTRQFSESRYWGK